VLYGECLPLHRSGGHGTPPARGDRRTRATVILLPGWSPPGHRAPREVGDALGLACDRHRPALRAPGSCPAGWKLRLFKTPCTPGETVSVAIGQGQVSGHPADGPLVSVIANGASVKPPPRTLPIALRWTSASSRRLSSGQGGMRAAWPAAPAGARLRTWRWRADGLPHRSWHRARAWRNAGNPTSCCRTAGSSASPGREAHHRDGVLVEHGNSGGESAAPLSARSWRSVR